MSFVSIRQQADRSTLNNAQVGDMAVMLAVHVRVARLKRDPIKEGPSEYQVGSALTPVLTVFPWR